MAAGRLHCLAGIYFLEGQVGQNVRNFYLKQIGDELDAISRHFGAADFPICDHIPRYGWVKGVQHGGEFLLADAVLMPKFANASPDEVLVFIHT
ncbi:MAG: hypothetical protein WBN22_14930 [Verrucomicrobiia bacterium]